MLVLLDCPISLLSLAWLLLLALAFVYQPLPGRWQALDGGSNILEAAMQGLVQRLGAVHRNCMHGCCLAVGSPCPCVKSLHLFALPPGLGAGGNRVRLRHSPTRHWAPLLLLATFAAADFACQAVLPAVAAADAVGWISLPDGLLDFLQSVVGLSHQARGLQLALLLGRPLALLAALALVRSGFSLGVLHRQLQEDSLSSEVQAARRRVFCSI